MAKKITTLYNAVKNEESNPSINLMLNSTYNECNKLMVKKYGAIKQSYFHTKTCKSQRASIKKGSEGLFIHHMDEDKGIMLSTSNYAVTNPWEWQQGERLVYCNLLEHLVLHIKIVEYPNKLQNKHELCGIGGIYNFIVPELNDIYAGIKYSQPWKQAVVKNIINCKNDYMKCISHLLKLTVKNPYYEIINDKKLKLLLLLNGTKKYNTDKKYVLFNDVYPLLTSFNSYYGTWNNKFNKKIYSELISIGVKQ